MAAFLNLKPIEKKCKKKKIKKFGIHSEFRIGCWDVLRKLQVFNYEKRNLFQNGVKDHEKKMKKPCNFTTLSSVPTRFGTNKPLVTYGPVALTFRIA